MVTVFVQLASVCGLMYVLLSLTQPRYVKLQLLLPEREASKYGVHAEGSNAVNKHWLLFICLTYGF